MGQASFAGRFKVGTRIFSGYGLVLTFLIAVAVLGYIALGKIGEDVVEFDRIADNTVRVITIDRNIAGLRRNVLAFTGGNSNTQALGRVRELETALRKDLNDAISATRRADRKAKLQAIANSFEQYATNFERIIDMRGRMTKDVEEKMNPLGLSMRATLTDIIDAAIENGKFENAARAGKAQESMMRARLSAIKFLTNPDPKLAEDVQQRINEYNERISSLLPLLTIQQNIDACKKAIEDGRAYLATFVEVSKLTLEIDHIVGKVNKDIATTIGDTISQVVNSQRDAIDKIGEDAKTHVTSQQQTSGYLSLLAIIMGLGFAFVVARSIIRPIHSMTASMEQLANGNLEIGIPALADKDEIGMMAKAVQVFKDNANEVERLKAEQVSQERR